MDNEIETLRSNSELGTRLPSLSLIELVIITAVMALVVTFQKRLGSEGISFSTNFIWFNLGQQTLRVLTIAIPFCTIWRFVSQKKTGGKFLVHPGHWFLFAMLVTNVGFICPILLQWYFVAKYKATLVYNFDIVQLIQIGSGTTNLIACVIAFAAMRKLSGWWRIALAIVATSLLLHSMQSFSFCLLSKTVFWDTPTTWLSVIYVGMQLTDFAMLCVVTLAAVDDIRFERYRELWHWIGVILIFLIHAATPLLQFISMRFFLGPTMI